MLARHPFPGDRDPRGNDWVTDTALDLIAHYDPGFVFLTYARQYYCSRYSPLTAADLARLGIPEPGRPTTEAYAG